MLELNAAAFYGAASSLRALQALTHGAKKNDASAMSAKHKDAVVRLLQTLQEHLKSMEAGLTSLAAARLLSKFGSSDITYNSFMRSVGELDQRLRDELCSKLVYVIESEKTKFVLCQEQFFGPDIRDSMPSSIYELDEAAMCIAFSRPTAAVFHLMRAMEIGMKATAQCLEITKPAKPAGRNWGSFLRKIDEAIKTRPAWSGPGDKAFFEEVYVTLDAIRNPWRNATMHVERKYTEEEAGHIFTAVCFFMKKIASRIDEDGKPHA
ncbi:MAG: hypothetical protein O2967_09125 [Proteobacteria bacterium]|nr:hypothetical protein [Pseudomonadota bacterium]